MLSNVVAELKAKQEEELARSLERDRKKQERKARQEGRKQVTVQPTRDLLVSLCCSSLPQEMESCVNGVVDEVLAREYREIVREVMFELAQVSIPLFSQALLG